MYICKKLHGFDTFYFQYVQQPMLMIQYQLYKVKALVKKYDGLDRFILSFFWNITFNPETRETSHNERRSDKKHLKQPTIKHGSSHKEQSTRGLKKGGSLTY